MVSFAPTSEETRWLRRHTRYLFDSLKQATLAALAIVFGMTVNLFWCALALGALAWWLGWLLNASGGLVGWNSLVAVGGEYLKIVAWNFIPSGIVYSVVLPLASRPTTLFPFTLTTVAWTTRVEVVIAGFPISVLVVELGCWAVAMLAAASNPMPSAVENLPLLASINPSPYHSL